MFGLISETDEVNKLVASKWKYNANKDSDYIIPTLRTHPNAGANAGKELAMP